MSLPIHRWFRYSAGFAASWVEEVLLEWRIQPGQFVLDPFAGSGTVPVVCDSIGINSIGVEAHPLVAVGAPEARGVRGGARRGRPAAR